MSIIVSAKIKFIFAVVTFGTIGVVSSFIPLSSSAIVFYRALIASTFLICISVLTKRKFDFIKIKKYLQFLFLTGIFMGLNWLFQFESFKAASVSIGTVCYNTMPIFVILLTPIMFKQKISIKNIVCICIAMVGIILVSNVILVGFKSKEIIGCFYGILGAVFYALVVMITKKMEGIDSYDKIIFQFIIATLIMIPYMLFIDKSSLLFTHGLTNDKYIIGIIMVLILGLFHTGIMYVIYFNSVKCLAPDTIAIFTYLDPVVSLVLSNLILNEKLNVLQAIGAILILLSTIINEFLVVKK